MSVKLVILVDTFIARSDKLFGWNIYCR